MVSQRWTLLIYNIGFPHLQEPADLHPSQDTETKAHVQYQVVPPTVAEVGQYMAGHQHQPDRYGPENTEVSDDYDD